MSKIAYIVDSSCFYEEKQILDHNLILIPLHVIIEGEDFLDGRNLDKEYLRQAIGNKKNVSTSQPSPGEVENLISDLRESGYTSAVFSVIGSGLSKTMENFMTTAAMEDFPVYPIDSGCVGVAQLYPILKARRLIESEKLDIEEAIKKVMIDINRSYTYLVPDDLFHLSRGGRLSPTAATLGSMLKIKPILQLVVSKGGEIDVVDKVRTTKKAYNKMIEIALKDKDLSKYKVIVAHFSADDKVKDLKKEIEKYDGVGEVEVLELTTAIGVHTGLETVGIQVVPKDIF